MDRVTGGCTDGSEDGWAGRTDGLSVGRMDSATDLRASDRQTGGVWREDGQTGCMTD